MTMVEQPYRRIVTDLQRRISAGELAAGARVPSTRAIVRDWGVAMATATKALSTLRREGWVRAIPGSGTVVSDRLPRGRSAQPRGRPTELNRDSVVRTGIALADREGRGALSMRRLAADLGIAPMSLYRYVPDKDELLRLMGDTALGEEELPRRWPKGWRARLEISARVQWRAYRRHAWLAPVLLNSLNRPPAVLSGMKHVEWSLSALAGQGLEERVRITIVVTLNGYVGGIAMSNALEVEAEQDTGISGDQRAAAAHADAMDMITPERFPALSAMSRPPGDLDEIFEFGLQRQLDGIATLLARHHRARQ